MFSAIYLAGGPTDLGSVRDIRVYRNNRLAETLDVYDFIINGDFSKNIRLEDNDLIMIAPYSIHVTVSGNVKRPMIYDMKDGETISDLLTYAAGFSDNANDQLVHVTRVNGERMETFNVLAAEFSTFRLKDGDVVTATSNIGRNRNIVTLTGAVWHPGSYAISDQVSTVRQLIEFAGGLREEAFMALGDAILLSGGFAIGASRTNIDIARRNIIDNSERSDTISVIYNFNIVEDPSALDFELNAFDIISVRPSPSYKPQQGITVNGEVVFPGYYVIESNVVRLSDVIARTGGCTEEDDRYTVGFDMKKALDNPGSYNDIVLQNGDIVNIPKLKNTVRISGAVLYPNTVVYDPSISVNQYVKMAGGYVKGAIKGKKYIVYMNGTASTRGSKNFNPMPGCEIIVPQKDRSQRQRISAAEIVSIASSTTSIATMVITMVNLLK